MVKTSAKKVVYLFGGGATQAEVEVWGLSEGVTLSEVTERVLNVASNHNILTSCLNDFDFEKHPNIEQLISLTEGVGSECCQDAVKQLRHLFQKDLLRYVKIKKPIITAALFQLHSHPDVKKEEKLMGVLTTNYDNVLDKAFTLTHPMPADYGIDYNTVIEQDKCTFPILKLHGSFFWKNNYHLCDNHHVRVVKTKKDAQGESLWIPPGLNKRFWAYPFNLVWGKAHQLLNCDVLRVVGSSLSPTDWELLTLIFKTQALSHHNRGYAIELIGVPEETDKQKSSLSLFGEIKSMEELDVYMWLDDPEHFYKLDMTTGQKDWYKYPNPFLDWVKQKVDYIETRHSGDMFEGKGYEYVQGIKSK